MSQDNFAQKMLIDQALIGRVMTQSTMVENMINAYVADFYTRCPNADYHASYLAFIYDMMNDRGVSLNTKVSILLKIYVRLYGTENKPSRSMFDKWVDVRNIFAHGNYIADQGVLYGGEFYDVQELADKHAKLQVKVNAELEKFAELRGPYFNHFPTKKWEDKK